MLFYEWWHVSKEMGTFVKYNQECVALFQVILKDQSDWPYSFVFFLRSAEHKSCPTFGNANCTLKSWFPAEELTMQFLRYLTDHLSCSPFHHRNMHTWREIAMTKKPTLVCKSASARIDKLGVRGQSKVENKVKNFTLSISYSNPVCASSDEVYNFCFSYSSAFF